MNSKTRNTQSIKGARKAITRSKKTFRVKFPSRKNNCMVHCESILESDAARLFEISYFVKSYQSQPSQETYYDNEGNPRTYYPDFEVTLWDDSLLDVEVKPASKLHKPEIKGKFEAIARRYQEQGRRFRILTEDNVRPEPLGSNLKLLAYCLQVPVHTEKLKALKQRLAHSKAITLTQATEILGQENRVYNLIATGFLATDLNQPLGPVSLIWIRNSSNGGENDPLRI